MARSYLSTFKESVDINTCDLFTMRIRRQFDTAEVIFNSRRTIKLPLPSAPTANRLLAPVNNLCEAGSNRLFELIRCRCGEMADAQDLKSWDLKKSCRFESDHRHQIHSSGFATAPAVCWSHQFDKRFRL
jgi:hypothetical protein